MLYRRSFGRSQPPINFTALLYDCFSVLRNTPADTIIPFTVSNGSPISHIRHLLSNDSSEQHLFLSCLACVPPAIWAGTTQDVPAVLEGWEVERVMQLLSAPDPTLRLKVRHFHFSSLKLFFLRHALSDSTHLDRCRLIRRRIVFFPAAKRPGPFCRVVRR